MTNSPEDTPSPVSPLRRLEHVVAFGVPLGVSVIVAWALVIRHHSVVPDALSRLSDGYYMLFSRNPHAAAIGFVWNPLPSLLDLPLIAFKSVWPDLATEAFASNLTTCVCFALACYQLFRFLEDLGLGWLARWGLWLCFAANPLVFYYGVNGMSEMIFLFPLMVTARYLTRWLHDGRTRSLVIAAFGLGFAYLARDEALAAAVAVGLVVAVVSYRREPGRGPAKRFAALTDVGLVLAPVTLAFVVWALMSWIIVGHPFEQFTSLYGNSNQLKTTKVYIQPTAGARFWFAVKGSLAVSPLLLPAVAAAALRARRKRDLRVLGPLAVMFAVLVFEIFSYTGHQTFPWLRFYIYACPATVMTAACLAVTAEATRTRVLAIGTSMFYVGARLAAFLLAAVALLLTVPGLVTTADTLGTSGGIADADRAQLAYILWPHSAQGRDSTTLGNYYGVKDLAGQIDSMHLPAGSLLVDVITPCIDPLILDSSDPKQFVIPSDYHYSGVFGAPYSFGIRYLLVPDPAVVGDDSLNLHYPSLFSDGQGIATLVRQIKIPSCPTLRLYKALPTNV